MSSSAAPIPMRPADAPDGRHGRNGSATPARNGHVPRLLAPVVARVLNQDREYRHYARPPAAVDPSALQDFVLAADDGQPVDTGAVFGRLRWGGQYVFASRSARRVAAAARALAGDGFVIEDGPAAVRRSWPPPLSLVAPRVHYVVARKVLLARPGEFSERFTFHVELVRHGHEYVVQKRVPTLESVVARLRKKFPEANVDVLEKRARKFVEKIFPTFLTREAGMLKVLEEHLPKRYQQRVPHVIELEKDIRGFVTTFKMNWLRNGGRPLSLLEFAMQSAELLSALHDAAGVVHLDLRLDNMVITDHGVGFVDFGSSVRVTENLATNPLLNTLFEELMRTSHIQRMLYTMTKSGQVTAEHLCSQYGKADKGVDVFYLALQFQAPHGNPDLAALIQYDPRGELARRITALSNSVLRPANPADSTYRSAKDILRSLEMIEQDLRGPRRA